MMKTLIFFAFNKTSWKKKKTNGENEPVPATLSVRTLINSYVTEILALIFL